MSPKAHEQVKVLAVVNRKGGVAKTTTAINLAHGLSRKLIYKVNPEDLDKLADDAPIYHYQDRYFSSKGMYC